jgi:predicted permease
MALLSRLASLARGLLRRSAVEDEMADEVRFHLERRAADLVASGMAPAEAARRARLEFGPPERWKDDCREARGLRWFDDLGGDLRYAARTFRRSPGFAVVAIVSLALGIGANVLVFTVVDALVLAPLPIADPERVVFVQGKGSFVSHSFPAYRDLRDRAEGFEGLVGTRISPMDVDAGTGSSRAWGYLATGNYFDVLGLHPALGRLFHPADDRVPGGSPFAVLSFEYWRSRFAGDPGVVGRTVRINRLPYTILGVAPKGFRGTERFYPADLWVPMMMQAQIEIGNPWLESRSSANTWVFGRLKAGVSREAALASLNSIAADLGRTYPRTDGGGPLKFSKPGMVGDALGAPVRAFTFGLLGLALLVLLTACANLASVVAARGADRHRELAVRLSIGAARGRIVRQLLTESMLLAALGGAAGYFVASIGARLLTSWHAPMDFPVQFEIEMSWTVFGFACGVSALAGVLFGLAPARRAAAIDPNTALKDGHQGRLVGGRLPFRELLLGAQVALCFVLVTACLLSLKGLRQALTMPLGFEPRAVAMAGFDLGLAQYPAGDGSRFQQRALDAVRGLPGVVAAAYSNSLPLSIDQSNSIVYAADRPSSQPTDGLYATHYQVSPGFFGTLGIRQLSGRDIDWQDTSGHPHVAVVNETFVRTVVRHDDAVGRTFLWGPGRRPMRIVGVVADGKYTTLTEAPRAALFVPILQFYNSTTTLLVRTAMPPEQVVPELRAAVSALDPQLTLYSVGTATSMLGFVLLPNQAAAVALSGFGLLALLLAATGIHGTAAYAVSRRRREIGIRMAIGATSAGVLRLVLGRMLAIVLSGAAAGLVLALVAGRLLASMIYQASPHDAAVLSAVGVTLVGVGALSCWAPARRSLRVDPATALRPE